MKHLRLYVYLMMVTLPACASVGNEAVHTLPPDWPPLGTPQSEILEKLGEPNAKAVKATAAGEEETWTYSYAYAESSPWLYVPIVGLGVAASGEGFTGESKTLALTFDRDKKVSARVREHLPIGQPSGPPGSHAPVKGPDDF